MTRKSIGTEIPPTPLHPTYQQWAEELVDYLLRMYTNLQNQINENKNCCDDLDSRLSVLESTMNGVFGASGESLSGWRDSFPVTSMHSTGGEKPSLQGFGPDGTIKQYRFNNRDSLNLLFKVSNDIKENSEAYFYIEWATDGLDTNTVEWEITFVSAITGEPFGSNAERIVEEPAPGVAWESVRSIFPKPIFPHAGDTIVVELKRTNNPGPNNTDNVFGLMCGLYYQSDKIEISTVLP